MVGQFKYGKYFAGFLYYFYCSWDYNMQAATHSVFLSSVWVIHRSKE